MPNVEMLKSVIKEYGTGWAVNRALYSAKLKMLKTIHPAEKFFEAKTSYPSRVLLFPINIVELKNIINGLSDEDKLKLISTADDACKGVIKGFSSTDLDYGNPIDWQLNPITGKKCDKNKKWFMIPDFDKNRGDIKIIWEASRFSHFITLARAFLLTEDMKYYLAFSEQLSSWLKENEYSLGANFKCSQECSLRMVNAMLSFTIFRQTGIATDADQSNVKDLVDRCYRKVLSNFFYAYKCIKNNHTISELMGMIVGAWCCEDEQQLGKAFRLLAEVIDEQFTIDGGYRQFSFNYQRLALQDLECILSIQSIVGKCLPEKVNAKIKNAAWLMYQCQDETGDMPNYGSNDGALIFPVTSCSYRDFRPVINTIYALITGEQLYAKGKHQEELLWFSGGKPLKDYPHKAIDRKSSKFPEAGLFTLRKKNSWAMIVLNDYKTRPAHLDQLHFDLWIEGVNVLCDAGTYSYASELGRSLVKNRSHNTVKIDGKSQMKVHGPFLIYNWTKRKRGYCDTNVFEGTMVSSNGYTHKRRVEQTDFGYRIIDSVNCDPNENIFILFHTPLDVECEGSVARLSWEGNKLFEIHSAKIIKQTISNRSLYYLKKENDTCIYMNIAAGESVVTEIRINSI